MLKIRLKKDLRRQVLRGHPWIYRHALADEPDVNVASFCQVLDSKGKALAWAIYDPMSVLSLRVLSVTRRPPSQDVWRDRIQSAVRLRQSVYSASTNAYRLINGEGDFLPGVIADIYNDLLVLQFDGDSMAEFWMQEDIHLLLAQITGAKNIYFKARHDSSRESQWLKQDGQFKDNKYVQISENGVRFRVNFVEGQKTGFFLDQRNNRQYLAGLAKDKTVLNLFSYTGGFSVYAGIGGAKAVESVDIAQSAIDECAENWGLNQLPGASHIGHGQDVSVFLKENQKRQFDLIMVDPPSMAPSEAAKPAAMKKYADIFSKAYRAVTSGGDLFLSSCSSHISFSDFDEIILSALSEARGHAQILRISGQGEDHPFPHACPELRYLKFYHLRKGC